MDHKIIHRLLMPLLFCCLAPLAANAGEPAQLQYRILETAPHDSSLFTQGLLMHGEHLVETSGGYGSSLIRRYIADDGKILQQASFPKRVFAEGIAQVDEQFFVLTWRAGVCFVVDATSLQLQATHTYAGEGWGLTYDGQRLIMSNGSASLSLYNPATFKKLGELPVTGGERTWAQLNELEYAENLIWANIWQDEIIIAIDPATGRVKGVLNLSELVKRNSHRPNHSVLNGIAYDPRHNAYWVTGKLWPHRYLIEIQWPETAAGNLPAEDGSQTIPDQAPKQ